MRIGRVLLGITLLLAPVTALSSFENSIRNRIILLGVRVPPQAGALFRGQINNQILSLFSNLENFELKSLSKIMLSEEDQKTVVKYLADPSSSRNSIPSTLISSNELRLMQQSYLLIFPEIKEYKSQSLSKTTTNSDIVTTNTTHSVQLRFSLHLYLPLTGKYLALCSAQIKETASHEIAAMLNAVTALGKRLAVTVENSKYFSSDTEVYQTDGRTLFFYNKDLFIPHSGMEYKMFHSKRFPDGFVEEQFKGYIRIKKQSGLLWKAKAITGALPEPGWKLRHEPTANLMISPVFRIYSPEVSGGTKFTVSGGSLTSRPQNGNYLLGSGIDISWYTGYSFRLNLAGVYIFDSFKSPDLSAYQLQFGFGWDFFPFKNLLISFTVNPYLQMRKELVGSSGGDDLSFQWYQPGAEASLGFQWMPQPGFRIAFYGGASIQFESLAFDQKLYTTDNNSGISVSLRAKEFPVRLFAGMNLSIKF